MNFRELVATEGLTCVPLESVMFASEILTTHKVITIDRLTDYCKAYDEIYGHYPESRYEGEGVLEFILECEGLP